MGRHKRPERYLDAVERPGAVQHFAHAVPERAVQIETILQRIAALIALPFDVVTANVVLSMLVIDRQVRSEFPVEANFISAVNVLLVARYWTEFRRNALAEEHTQLLGETRETREKRSRP